MLTFHCSLLFLPLSFHHLLPTNHPPPSLSHPSNHWEARPGCTAGPWLKFLHTYANLAILVPSQSPAYSVFSLVYLPHSSHTNRPPSSALCRHRPYPCSVPPRPPLLLTVTPATPSLLLTVASLCVCQFSPPAPPFTWCAAVESGGSHR